MGIKDFFFYVHKIFSEMLVLRRISPVHSAFFIQGHSQYYPFSYDYYYYYYLWGGTESLGIC
jgi:hypothetical protein